MKKTCYGCKALELNICALGYQQKRTYNVKRTDGIENIQPVEDCPKPLSTKKLFKYIKAQKGY